MAEIPGKFDWQTRTRRRLARGFVVLAPLSIACWYLLWRAL
jgi:hypothetical protein